MPAVCSRSVWCCDVGGLSGTMGLAPQLGQKETHPHTCETAGPVLRQCVIKESSRITGVKVQGSKCEKASHIRWRQCAELREKDLHRSFVSTVYLGSVDLFP